jgi:branched-chain amino acid transport system substrate-binding protein
MKTSRWRALAVLAVLVLTVAACTTDATEDTGSDGTTATTAAPPATAGTSDTDAPASDDGPIVIGGVGPLSEPGAVAGGIDMKWAMELAVADVNDAGGVMGRQLELSFEDTQNTPEVAASVAKKLTEEDDVVAVIGEYHSGAALAAIPVYSAAGMPVVFSETWNDMITGGDPDDPKNLPANPPTIFRIAPTSSYFSNFIVDWWVNGLEAKKVIHLYEATDYGIGADAALTEQLAGTGVTLISQQLELNQPDYSSVLARLAEEHGDADVVSIGGVTGDSSFTVTQGAFDVGLIGSDTVCHANITAIQSEAFWAAVPDGAGCAVVYIGPPPAAYNDITNRVVDAYQAEFGGSPGPWVFEAYDSVWLVADAIERAGSTDPAAVVSALESSSFIGAQGQYAFPYNAANQDTPEGKAWLWHQWPEPAIALLEYTETGQPIEDAAIIWPKSLQTHGSAYIPAG